MAGPGFRSPAPLGAPAPSRGASVGTAVPAADARARVTGRAPFAIDAEVPGMLHGKLLRSTVAHGRIARLDVRRAAALPGVAGVLTGDDLRGGSIAARYGPIFPDRPLVAIDRVRYAGEPVAVVVARRRGHRRGGRSR